MNTDLIIIRGARQHNLKNIDVDLPRNRLVVLTGLSGSGKSTLAFDTLYAEGQRRYVESLSAYARQFLERLDKPDVELIEGLSPAIAIEQKSAGHNPRSTVGTVTEIYDYLRLLYARIGTRYCPHCDQPVAAQSLDQIIDQIKALGDGTRLIILAPLVTGQKGSHADVFKHLRKQGFARVRIDGSLHEINAIPPLQKNKPHDVDVVIDRLIVKPTIANRLADSLELALAQGEGKVTVGVINGQPISFSEQAACTTCGFVIPELTPSSFSFNSPKGACPVCDGLGATTEFDPDLIIPNPTLSLRDGAVAMWANRHSVYFTEFLDTLTGYYREDIYTPYQELSDRFKQVLLYGSGDEKIPFYTMRNGRPRRTPKPFEGIIPNSQRRYLQSDSSQAREEAKQYMRFTSCSACKGARLNPVSRAVRIGGIAIPAMTALPVDQLRRFLKGLNLKGKQKPVADRVLKAIFHRLEFLENVGLVYLTLDRSADSLSGGESQRIRLATQIGAKLTGVLYVLDEPSIGLHQRDNQRLLKTLCHMRDMGNTVLVVEHDEETIRSADHVIDMGPGAGINGGQIVFTGSPDALCRDETSLTGLYLSGRKRIEIPSTRRANDKETLVVHGACENNLKHIDVAFPLGCLVCITGVSGSGKSTLMLNTLHRALLQHLHHARIPAGKHTGVTGLEQVDKVVNINQAPIGRTPRSNPVTYTGVFTFIRDLFARTLEARARGYKTGRFSFNVKGGRCEACRGDGIVKIEMHFLPNVYVTCDVCHGKRYNRETLEIQYKSRDIAQVLDMTVNQCLKFFNRIPSVRPKLQTLVDVGLGYIRIGQPGTTLSGGEAQRIKLARELAKKGTGRTVYIMDEPTTGLHPDDINRLLTVLNRLVDGGNTVIIIEHNLDVIKTADHIIDLGPEGGEAGGNVVASGTPEEIAANPASHTGRYLRKVL
jgi:excinuclease ABC subunit A